MTAFQDYGIILVVPNDKPLSTYEPRLILNSGLVVRLPGGLSHASAMAAAELAAEARNDVEYIVSKLERDMLAA